MGPSGPPRGHRVPAHRHLRLDFGPFTISGTPGYPEAPVSYCPRRTVLDKLLVDAAAEAGAEIHEGFAVDEVLTEDGRVVGIKGHAKGGESITERARVVIGADGRNSLVAGAVRSAQYHEKPPLLASYYTYWSGVPMNGRFETYIRSHRGFAAMPTHGDLTLVIAGWPHAEFGANKGDIEGHYMKTLALAPAFAQRVGGAKREARFLGASVRNYFRKPYGPGWALVGDAGYNKDPITAQGITDAFCDAERCAIALDEAFRGARPFDDAMADYQHARDAHVLPMYEFTCQLAMLEPPPPELQQLLGAIHGNQQAMDSFVRMNARDHFPSRILRAGQRQRHRGCGRYSALTRTRRGPGGGLRVRIRYVAVQTAKEAACEQVSTCYPCNPSMIGSKWRERFVKQLGCAKGD